MEDKTLIIIVALIVLAVVEIAALGMGYDGAILASVVGIFAYTVGFKHHSRRT